MMQWHARWLQKVAGALAVVSSVAVGSAWGQASAPAKPAKPANQATIGEPAAFGLAECKAKLFDGSPAVAVMFNQPLARAAEWGRYVKAFEGDKRESAKPVKGNWVLGDNPRVLYLPFVTPDRTFHIEVDAQIKAADASAKLPKAANCNVRSDAMPASYYFASQGVVLPAGQNGGLPVVTVNTPEVDMQFLRIQTKSLPAFWEKVAGRREKSAANNGQGEEGGSEDDYWYGANPKLKGQVSSWDLDNLREMSTSVYTGRFTTDARKNRRNVSFLPVEKIPVLQEPGIYVAIMNQPGRFGWDYQVTYFYVTDIGLHVRRFSKELGVFATSLKTGLALPATEVLLVDANGATLAQTKTGGDGYALFTGVADKARSIVAKRGKDLSLVALRDAALDLSEFDVGGHLSRNQKLFVYAGRDLYRPGEGWAISILLRDADGKLVPLPRGAGAQPLTVQLKQPDGQTVSTQLVAEHKTALGYYQHRIELPTDAATGRWTLEVRQDPAAKRADAQWTFQVEEFLPERMKLDLKAPEGALLDPAKPLHVAVEGNYLYGAPAAGNRLLTNVFVSKDTNPMPQALPGFVFGKAEDDSTKQRRNLDEVALDDAGKAAVDIPLEVANADSPMRIRASFSLLESGGRPVVRSIERTWWPARELVGLRPLFSGNVVQEGSNAEFEITRVNTAGKFAQSKALQVQLYREDRNWYWRYDDGRGWNSGYTTSDEIIETRVLNLTARSKMALPVRYGRYRLEVLDPATKLITSYRFYAGWGAQDAEEAGNRPDRVQLKLEGAPFKPGGIANLTITPPHDGEAIVTVEGDRILYQKRLAVRAAGTKLQIPVDPSWSRHDLYITVAAFRPGSQGNRVTPSRALGLVHLPLSRESRKLKVTLDAPQRTAPERSMAVKVKLNDASGQPFSAGKAFVTLSAVDVGILNITRYPSPDPVDFFFGKHRYAGDMLDLYGKLIEKMDGNTAKQRFGGDASKRDTQSMPRKVLLVDVFSGPVVLDAKGEATIPVALPDFNGTLRLMAVAATADSYANAQAEVTVAAPIVAELSMPRFIAAGDKATIALDVTNLSGAAQDVGIKVTAASPLQLEGTGTSQVALADKQRQVLRFNVTAMDAVGMARIQVTVTAAGSKLVRESVLQVQPATPLLREVQRLRLDAGSTHTVNANRLNEWWTGSASVRISLSNKPPIDVRSAVEGLLMYPYGCLEQTTSSAYPLVFIDEDGAKAVGIKGLSKEERAKRLDTAFGRLSGMQQSAGGFGLWSASSPYEAWLSAYVTGFLSDAREAGFAVPESMEKKSLTNLLEQFQRTSGNQITLTAPAPDAATRNRTATSTDWQQLQQAHQRLAETAYAGYILARAQRAPLATLRTLHDKYRGNARSPLVLVHLGLALKLMGDEARAKVSLDDAFALTDGLGRGDTRYEWLGDYGSKVRDYAMAYALMHRHKVSHPKIERWMDELANAFDQRSYYSTQERLALFLAARAAGGSSNQNWLANITVGNKTEQLKSGATEQRTIGAADVKRGLSISNKGAERMYIEIAQDGYPLKPVPVLADNIQLERTWWTVQGTRTENRNLKVGDMYVVRVKVSAKQRIKDAMVVDRVPAGVEVENLNLSKAVRLSDFKIDGREVATDMADPRIKHTEYRDDRFVAATDLDGSTQYLYYLVRVVTPGKFVVPAPFAEDMYRPDIRGIGKAEADIHVADPRAK